MPALNSGLLHCLPFLQPAVFLPHSAIRSVELMRAGGASSTFDVVLHLKRWVHMWTRLWFGSGGGRGSMGAAAGGECLGVQTQPNGSCLASLDA